MRRTPPLTQASLVRKDATIQSGLRLDVDRVVKECFDSPKGCHDSEWIKTIAFAPRPLLRVVCPKGCHDSEWIKTLRN